MHRSFENRFEREIPDLPRGSRVGGILVVGIIIVLALAGLGSLAIVRVPSGNRGVLITLGKVEDKVLGEGLNFKNPVTQSVIFMDVQIQKAESTESTATKDLQEVSTTVAVNYRLDPNKVNVIYQTLRQDYVSRVIKPNIQETLKATTALYRAEELITKRAEVKSTFDEILVERLSVFDIYVISVSLTDFQFSRSFSEAIEAKVTAEQDALKAKNELERIRYEAQQQVIQAEAARNATVTRALGEAQAQIIEANATAASILLITSQMTDEYAQYLWLNQWDGKLPLVISGEGQGFILDINSLINKEP